MDKQKNKKPLHNKTTLMVGAVLICTVIGLLTGCSGDKAASNLPPAATGAVVDKGDTGQVIDDPVWEGEEIEPDYEDAYSIPVEGEFYKNESVVTYVYNKVGDSISLGVKGGGGSGMVYLNPVASVATTENKVGFYITPSRCTLSYSDSSWASVIDPGNAEASNVIINWTYDELIPAQYADEKNYGVGWSDDMLFDGRQAGTDLFIRAIDLTNGRLLAVLKATIEYDANSGTYALTGLQSNDVKDTGEMTETDREAVLDKAYELLAMDGVGPILEAGSFSGGDETYMEEIWQEAVGAEMRDGSSYEEHMAHYFYNTVSKEDLLAGAFVEHTGTRFYFDRCLDREGDTAYGGRLALKYGDFYAVSIPLDNSAFVTMYYTTSPEATYLYIEDEETEERTEVNTGYPMDLKFIAYDLAYPYSRSHPMAPSGLFK